MRFLINKFPAGSLAVLNLIAGGIASLMGHPEYAPIFVAVAAMLFGLQVKVVSKKEARETTIRAAADAATTVAANLTSKTVGVLGEVTQDGSKIVDNAVGAVTGLLGR